MITTVNCTIESTVERLQHFYDEYITRVQTQLCNFHCRLMPVWNEDCYSHISKKRICKG